jgi:uncharacterized SAM-binding protein YcdF (DUF218 family)
VVGSLVDAFKAFIPGSLAFLVLGVGVGAAFLFIPRISVRRIGLSWLGVLTALYVLLGLPWTARHLAFGLDRYRPLSAVLGAQTEGALAVFDGDHSSDRVHEAIRLYRLLLPREVIVSGGQVFRNALERGGIPQQRITWDSESRTTREQALALSRKVVQEQLSSVVLVASPLHMPRALGTCRAVGVSVVPAVSARPHPRLPVGAAGLIPSRSALALSYEALYEYVALAYYRLRGWVDP